MFPRSSPDVQLIRGADRSRNAVVERIKQKVKEEVEDKSKCLICFDRFGFTPDAFAPMKSW